LQFAITCQTPTLSLPSPTRYRESNNPVTKPPARPHSLEDIMRRWQSAFAYTGVLTLGYIAGVSGLGTTTPASAQEAAAATKPNVKLGNAITAISEAADTLKTDGNYDTITQGTNAFLVLSGGGNAKADLESGQGVDPETYGALYAGLVIPELADQVTKDDNGRLVFNGQVIHMYSRSKLQRAYANRLKLAGAR
jgi:hypothetical protein